MKRLLIVALVVTACGKDAPMAPTPPKPQTIAGSWSGTFETVTYTTTPILVDINQINATVTGTWASSGGGAVRPFGNINGTVDVTRFVGTVTYNYMGGPTCSGSFAGSVSPTTIDWTSPGFTTGDCGLSAPGNPLGVRFVLQRR